MQNYSSASLAEAIPASSLQGLAHHFGASEQTILQGVQSSIASVVGGLNQKSGDRGFLGQVVQLASSTQPDAVTASLSNGALANPASPFLTGGTRFLSSIFGNRLNAVTDSLGRQTGLRSTAATALLALGGQTILGFLGEKIRNGTVDVTNLPAFLQKESDALKGMLPPGFYQQTSATTHKVDVDPVVAQTVQPEKRRSIWPWLLALLLALLLLGFWWYRSHQQPTEPATATAPQTPAPPVAPAAQAPITSANGADLGALVDNQLPDGTTLHIPEKGVEGKLLAFIKDPARPPDKTSWFDFDRLLFDTGSATLQPQSAEQLHNIAAILKAYPAVHLTIGGYTDNTGNAAQNLKLSRDRADSVVSQLETMGIDRDRLVSKGYGDQHPVADNSTADGRTLNRRISMLVTKK